MSPFQARWAVSLLCILLGGCALLPTGKVATQTSSEAMLATLQTFVAADADTKAAIFSEATSAAALTPTAENRLRVALLQGWPGHRYSAPREASNRLDALIESGELDADGQGLASVLHHWLAQRGTDQRLQRSLRERIATLERELAETRRQLDALAELERLTTPVRVPCNQENDDDCPPDRADPARR
ncbi:MAG: hypothetical protein LC632_06055 [Xanthomonadaceae bacterium]|nr:hypothetical protein [Xanthomonadaceae bacterium]